MTITRTYLENTPIGPCAVAVLSTGGEVAVYPRTVAAHLTPERAARKAIDDAVGRDLLQSQARETELACNIMRAERFIAGAKDKKQAAADWPLLPLWRENHARLHARLPFLRTLSKALDTLA